MKTTELESLFNKFEGFQAGNLITKILQQRWFPVNIAKFLKASVLKIVISTGLRPATLSKRV